MCKCLNDLWASKPNVAPKPGILAPSFPSLTLPFPTPCRRLLINFRQLSGDMERGTEHIRAELASKFTKKEQEMRQVSSIGMSLVVSEWPLSESNARDDRQERGRLRHNRSSSALCRE